MLILTRRVGETLRIGDEVKITVCGLNFNSTRFGIEAPDDIAVHREEIYQRLQQQRQDLSELDESKTFEGAIVTLVTERRFGFVRMEELKHDVFFHADEVVTGNGYNGLRPGDLVEFELRVASKGYQAKSVRLKQF